MATSTLIQDLSSTGITGVSNRVQKETFLAGATIAAGDIGKVAMLDLTKTGVDKLRYVKLATAKGDGQGLAVGVIQNAAAAGERVTLIVAGYAPTVTSGGSVAAGAVLTASPTSHAAQILARVAGDKSAAFGVALETATSPACWIYKQF